LGFFIGIDNGKCQGGVRHLIELDEKKRIIQEFVPGKQVTLAHVIAHPDNALYTKLGLIDTRGAIGIFTITPGEAAIIAADVATKSAHVSIGFVDRFSGSLVVTGDVASVEASLREVMRTLCDQMGFTPAPVTRS
jgi:ethanolamine utilization protein EutS